MLRKILLASANQMFIYRTMMKIPATRKFAFRFVAGEDVSHALATTRVLNALGINVSLDHLGENVTTREEAIAAANDVIDLLQEIKNSGVKANVSLKLTQLGLDLDFEFCRQNLARVLSAARESQNFIRLDMEGSAYTQLTLDMFRTLRENHGYMNCGVVIQSYLFRSATDVSDLIKMGAKVRLCKGAYNEPPEIAFALKSDTDDNYIKLMQMLLTSGEYHGIATHDEKMIEATKEFAREALIDKARFEFQMLFGIRRDLQRQLVKEGYNVRVYVPYGTQWYPYFTRRLAERPANLFFLLGNLFRK